MHIYLPVNNSNEKKGKKRLTGGSRRVSSPYSSASGVGDGDGGWVATYCL
jgi:hypothetical protein